MAKRAGRLAAARGAYDELIPRIHRAQADALVIEAEAERRLADAYDAAQERGEVSVKGQHGAHVPDGNMRATAADIGLSRKDIHEARRVRDAEAAAPGLIRRTADAAARVVARDRGAAARLPGWLRQVTHADGEMSSAERRAIARISEAFARARGMA